MSSRGGVVFAGAVLVVLGSVGLYTAMRRETAPVLTLEEQYLQDDRLRPLIYDCGFGKQYDADTSDMVPIMVRKLIDGGGQPRILRSLRQELADLGAPAVPELRRLFDSVYGDQWQQGVLTNILTACALMPEPAGLEMGRLGLQHPAELVRLSALDVVVKHGDASDYDRVRPWLDLASSARAQGDYLTGLLDLDPDRFFVDLADWVEAFRYKEGWPMILSRLCEVTQPDVVQRFAAAGLVEPSDEARRVPGNMRPFLVAPAARDGDASALAWLESRLASDVDVQAQMALEALRRVGMGHYAGPFLRSHSSPGLRLVAAEIIGEMPQSAETHALLVEGTSDPDPEVREHCLETLAARGDEQSINQALLFLTGTPADRQLGIQILVGAWGAQEDLPLRALDVATREYEQTSDLGLRVSILKAVGRIPLRAAAEFLLDSADDFGEYAISGLRPYRWAVGQAFNVGPEGVQVLRERLGTQTDPFRRLDLINFIWQDHSAASREVLLEAVLDESRHPLERLYIADSLTRIGPAGTVAPVLKQVYLGNTDAVVRPALQCLLWSWYGAHY